MTRYNEYLYELQAKMEIYKKTLEDKMENFNPLEFNLIDKEFFNMEKEKM